MIDAQAVEKSEQHRFKGRNVTTLLSSHTASWDLEHRAPLMPEFSTERYRQTVCFGSHFKIDMLELARRLQEKTIRIGYECKLICFQDDIITVL
jgi:hypothetical protein